jgi:hypothetical protein
VQPQNRGEEKHRDAGVENFAHKFVAACASTRSKAGAADEPLILSPWILAWSISLGLDFVNAVDKAARSIRSLRIRNAHTCISTRRRRCSCCFGFCQLGHPTGRQPVRLAYQSPASSTFLSEQTSNQPAVLFSQNKPAPAISHQPTESPTDRKELIGLWRRTKKQHTRIIFFCSLRKLIALDYSTSYDFFISLLR